MPSRPTPASPARFRAGTDTAGTGDKVHTRLDPATERVKPKLAVIVEQASPVQDRYCTDVPGPAEVVPQENLKL